VGLGSSADGEVSRRCVAKVSTKFARTINMLPGGQKNEWLEGTPCAGLLKKFEVRNRLDNTFFFVGVSYIRASARTEQYK
jgi:hypothetical protein